MVLMVLQVLGGDLALDWAVAYACPNQDPIVPHST
jgi:hypothetical protein